MQSHEILREVFQSASVRQIATDQHLSTSTIYKWAARSDASGPEHVLNPLDRLDLLLQSTQDARLVHWICQRAGGFFIRNPHTHHAHPDYLIPATNEIVQEFADLLAVIANAAADNQIDAAEAQKIRGRWEELKAVTETFVQCCEKGNFGSLKNLSGARGH